MKGTYMVWYMQPTCINCISQIDYRPCQRVKTQFVERVGAEQNERRMKGSGNVSPVSPNLLNFSFRLQVRLMLLPWWCEFE